MSAPDLSKVGPPQAATLNITAVEPPQAGKSMGWLSAEGIDRNLGYFTDDYPAMQPGELAVEVHTKAAKDGGVFAWIKPPGSGQKKGSGGAGRRCESKEFYAEIAPSVGGIYAHAIDKGFSLEACEAWAKSYIKIIGGAKLSPPMPKHQGGAS